MNEEIKHAISLRPDGTEWDTSHFSATSGWADLKCGSRTIAEVQCNLVAGAPSFWAAYDRTGIRTQRLGEYSAAHEAMSAVAFDLISRGFVGVKP